MATYDNYLDSFEDDYSLGAVKKKTAIKKVASATKRLVVLSGTAECDYPRLTISFPLTSYLRNAFTNAGWELVNFNVSWASSYNYTVNIHIEAMVLNTYSAEQARQNALQLINNFQATHTLRGLYKPYSEVNLQVISDFKTTTTQKEVETKANNTWTLPNLAKKAAKKTEKVVYDAAKATGNAALETVKESATGMFGNMGYTLPIAGCVLLVIVLVAVKVK
jgi:hypothetical protein